MSKNPHIRYVFVLGAISAVGPFSVDMYLSSLPAIVSGFGVGAAAVQLTLVAFFLAQAVGQPIYGPISDMIGRRPPLFAGLALFVLASLGCALAPNVQVLIAMRFLQGLGACAGMVISRAVVRDVFSGAGAVRLLSSIMLVFSVSPILAPLAGSTITAFLSWRWIFAVLSVVALGSILATYFFLPETLAPQQRQAREMGAFFRAYGRLARDGRFMARVALGGFSQGVLYAYLAAASLVFIKGYGMAPLLFSVVFAVNAIGLIGLAQMNAPLVRRFGSPMVVVFGCSLGAICLAPLAVTSLFVQPPLWVVLFLLWFGFAGVGMIGGPNTMIALESQREGAGAASSMMGALQFAMGAGASAVVGLIPGRIDRAMFCVMAVCWFIALVFAAAMRRSAQAQPLSDAAVIQG